MILLYQLILVLASPLLAIWIIFRLITGKMQGLGERLGKFHEPLPAPHGPRLWIHAVSLGEVKLAAMLADQLRQAIPNLEIVFTTSTGTGRQEAERAATARDFVFYPPIDFAWICRRFIRHICPAAAIIVETELWPNLFHQLRFRNIPLVMVNGRISDRSWPRYRATSFLWAAVLKNVNRIYASSERDAERFRLLGMPENKLTLAGNLKFQLPRAALGASVFVNAAQSALETSTTKVLVAGSTMPGEEAMLIDAYSRLQSHFPALWMILAPRHPERFDGVASLLQSGGMPFRRRSQLKTDEDITPRGILLLDTIGELAACYQLADVAFVGGTLVATGGHNIIEPAMYGKAIVVGPSMDNFREILDRFLAVDAGVRIQGARVGSIVEIAAPAALPTALQYLLENPREAARLGTAAKRIIDENQLRGASAIGEIARLLQAT
jgi:3-deoxy-D-manno-octulosonic-acid transferase